MLLLAALYLAYVGRSPVCSEEICQDLSPNCRYYKEIQGYCKASSDYPTYMQANCRHACGYCTKPDGDFVKKTGVCEDSYETECENWKEMNFCTHAKTRGAMKIYCPKTCSMCDTDSCTDNNKNCSKWAKMGVCSLGLYVRFMELECSAACGYCTDTCTDNNRHCKSLAENGLCEEQPDYMRKHCTLSCEMCGQAGWSTWGDWSVCDAACGKGYRYRSRQCEGGPECEGSDVDNEPCTSHQCNIILETCEDKTDFCPYFFLIGFCDKDTEFMQANCAATCKFCDPKDVGSGGRISDVYKMCVDRVLDEAIKTSLNRIGKFTEASEDKKKFIQNSPITAQASLRQLSKEGKALAINDQLFKGILTKVDTQCGKIRSGTSYIESKLLSSKVITITKVDCSDRCFGGTVNYRNVNGTCNNCDNPLWGSVTDKIGRLLEPVFEDDAESLPRGWNQGLPADKRGTALTEDQILPGPRLVSNVLLKHDNEIETKVSLMHFQWGQFLDHDITLIPTNPNSVEAGGDTDCEHVCHNQQPCFPIVIPLGDPLQNHTRGMRGCLPFTRSAAIRLDTSGASDYTHTNQINEVTSFIDGSNLYGSSNFLATLLRNSTGQGTLKTGNKCAGTDRGDMLPDCPQDSSGHFCICEVEECPQKYMAGDTRVNEQPMLAVMHTLWMREHNRIAHKLAMLNDCWDSNKVYEETKKVVGAIMQHITYRIYLPLLLGPEGYSKYIGFTSQYEPKLEPRVLNEFATAAFRFGHSQIPASVPAVNKDWTINVEKSESLAASFFRAQKVCLDGFDSILRGLVKVPVMRVDSNFVKEVKEKLFAPSAQHMGLDLISINIQRGRDHGLAPYYQYKEYCERKYKVKATFREKYTGYNLRRVYSDLDKVDLFVGGMLEAPVHEGMLGATFSCIVGEQFRRLRDGDRFYYSHQGVFKPAQMAEIKKASMSNIVCENSASIDKVPHNAFMVEDPANYVSCKSLPGMNFEKWVDKKCQ